ncbi:MAG: metallophosphoesterase family protein [Lachnospiraceae bacterium]|nr:metallophosphoesterase family protein [Lachnospiraceae bacterium]
MHRIGIISDTHGLLRPEVEETLQGCEAILHGGDINKPEILDKLNRIAPTYVVRGNNDKEWAKELPETLSVSLCGIGFFMVHNKKYIPKKEEDLKDIDIIVYGHSHKYEEKQEGGRLLLNPGSCGPRRFTQPITFAVLAVGDDGAYKVEKVEVAHPAGATKADRPEAETVTLEQEIATLDMKRVVKAVMRDTNRRRSVGEIAVKNGISEELTEQICRLYLTHPGVSADGIIDKMGLPKNR